MSSTLSFDLAKVDPGAAHRFDTTVLREYDLRGIVGETITAADAYALGRAFGSFARRRGARALAVGYDGRESSPMLATALAAGLAACGIAVTTIGRGPTPMLYFAAYTMGFDGAPLDGGVMITGSHNPPDFNGFKLVLHKASVFGPDIQELGRIAAAADYESSGRCRRRCAAKAATWGSLSTATATAWAWSIRAGESSGATRSSCSWRATC